MKSLKKISLFIGIISLIFIIFNFNKVYASSVELTASTTSATVGDTITVTATVTSGSWNLNLSVAGQNRSLVGQTSTTGNETTSTSITFTADEARTYVATLTGDETDYDTDITTEGINKTLNIEVKPKETTPEPDPEPEPTPDPEPSLSSDTSLASLSISPFGVIGIASTGIYDITVDNSLESVTITGVANDPGATIVSGNGTYNLEEGTNRFAVVVRAPDGSEESHSIRIIRKTAGTIDETTPPNVIDETNDPNNNDDNENKEDENTDDENAGGLGLSNLVITGLELNPTFATDVYEYKAEFAEDLDTLEVIATANQENANVEIVGNSNLQIGENLITIIVTSEDGETTVNYQITVTKNEPEAVAASTTDENTTTNQELRSQVGKIILIAAAAIILVILIGIIVIINTRKKAENDFSDTDSTPRDKIKKGDFKVAVDEDESYRELEKLSNIHNNSNKNNIFDTKNTIETTTDNVEMNVEETSNKNETPNTGIFENNNTNTSSNITKNDIFGSKNTENSINIERSEEIKKENNIFGNTKAEEIERDNFFIKDNQNTTKPTVSDIWDNDDDTDSRDGKSSKGKRFK